VVVVVGRELLLLVVGLLLLLLLLLLSIAKEKNCCLENGFVDVHRIESDTLGDPSSSFEIQSLHNVGGSRASVEV